MERIVIFARTTKTEGDIKLRFRLTDGRRADLYHKSNIKASLADLAKFNVDGSLRPKVSVYNKELEDNITKEIDAMRRAYRKMVESGGIITAPKFEEAVAKELNPEVIIRKEEKTLLSSMHKYIEDGYRDGLFGLSRYKHFNGLHNRLERYFKINGLEQMTPAEFDVDEIMKFRQFLFDEYLYVPKYKHIYKGLKKLEIPTRRRGSNTVAQEVKMLITFFNYLEVRDEIVKSPFRRLSRDRRKKITQTKEDDPIFLTIDELEAVMATEVPETLKETKDAFLVHCALGCRISDFKKLKMEHIFVTDEGIPYIHYLPQKTKESQANYKEIKTPLVRYAFDIIKAKEFQFRIIFYEGGKSGYNKKIKQLLELAGIDRKVSLYNEELGENEFFPLYQCASSKTARSTCVDIMAKYQIDRYAAGLHRRGSKAVERYTNMEIRDDFALRNIAYRQKAYKVDENLNVLQEEKPKRNTKRKTGK